METVKIGEILFVNMSLLNGYSIGEFHDCEYVIKSGSEEVKNYLNTNLKVNDCLIAVKYVGNGIFEEMTTHEKLAIEYAEVSFVGDMASYTYLDDNVRHKEFSLELDYEDYLNENEGKNCCHKLNMPIYYKKLCSL